MSRRARALLLLLTTALLAGTGTGLWSAAQHRTLHDIARWGSSKTDCEKGLIGGAMARLTRPMLFRGHLDLSAWFGFQEVYLVEPLRFDAARFRLRLAPGGWLAVGLEPVDGDRPPARFGPAWGIRLATDDAPAAGSYAVDGRGLFDRFDALADRIDAGRWHEVECERDGDARFLCRVDGREIARFAVPDAAVGYRLGFRGGSAGCLVDDVTLHDGTTTVLTERFDRRDLWPLHLGVAGLAFLLLGGVLRALGARRSATARDLLPPLVLLILAGLAWGLFVLDEFWAAARYPTDPLRTPDYRNTMFDAEAPEGTWEQRFPAGDPERAVRILFVGSSQTWGSGARVESETWTRLVERRLNAARPTPGFRVANSARSGDRLADQVARLRAGTFAEVRPDVVVVNMSHNDLDTAAFGVALVALWELVSPSGARLFCMLEANSPDREPESNLAANHEVIRQLAGGAGLPILDAHAALAAADARGFLWWDRVHLTSAGQAVLAEFVADELLARIR